MDGGNLNSRIIDEYIENSINQKKLYTHIYTNKNDKLYGVKDGIVFRRYKINDYDYSPTVHNTQLNELKLKIIDLKKFIKKMKNKLLYHLI